MRDAARLSGVGLLAVVCCATLTLLVAAGLSVAAFALIGGLAGIVTLGFAIMLLARRASGTARTKSAALRARSRARGSR